MLRILSCGSPSEPCPQTQQSTENRCHQIQSTTSSLLSATPVTLPALSLYPQASSITYQASRSSGNDVTTSPQANHSPTLSSASYAKHKDSGAALNMAGRTQISQALGMRIFELSVLWVSSKKWQKIYLMVGEISKSKFFGVGLIKKKVNGKCFVWQLDTKHLTWVKANTDKWEAATEKAYKQTKKQTNLKLPSLHLHSTGFLHCFLHTNPELVYRLWDRSIWSAVSLDEVTVPCYYGAQGRLFFPNVYGTRRS